MFSPLTPPVRRGGKEIRISNNTMDIESIRARRARLEDMINTMRLPPLSRTSSLSNPLLKGTGSPNNTTIPSYLQRRRSLETPSSMAPRTPASNQRLPDTIFPLTPMTCRHFIQPLPDIGRTRNAESRQQTPRLASGKRSSDSEKAIEEEKRPATSKSRISEGPSEASEDEEIKDIPCTEESIATIVHGMGSNSQEKKLEYTIQARTLLSRDKDPPISSFLKADVLTPLMPLLQTENNDKLLYEATWALTNIAAGSSKETEAVVNAGAVPILVKVLKHESADIKEQAAWALGNISGEGTYYRNLVLQAGIVGPLHESLAIEGSQINAKLSLVRVVAWVLSNIFRHKGITISAEERKKCLDALKILVTYDDEQVIIDSLWAISYIAKVDDESLQDVVDSGLIPALITHMGSNSKPKVSPALRAIGNIATGNDVQTDAVLENQALPILKILLEDSSKSIKKDATWTISNITAGTKTQIQQVVDADILPVIVRILETAPINVQKEAAWAVANLTDGGTHEQMSALIDAEAVPALMKALSLQETSITSVSLTALSNLLKVPEREEEVRNLVKSGEGMETLENLAQHIDPSISIKANKIIESLEENEQSEKEEEEESSNENDSDANDE
ncbi:uncharacterized protein [Palaemon carinicauda]|uniref:uncharacterized protein n=1 Tax=Palaemon carinicauda TaxID=392227 RepID=UPI0035B5D406